MDNSVFKTSRCQSEEAIYVHCHHLRQQFSTRFPPTRLVLLLMVLLAPLSCHGGNYSQKKAIHDTLITKATYSPNIRPLQDQDGVLHVTTGFELVSIVEVNDVVQRFQCNGFLAMWWRDEILQWDPTSYGGEDVISPKITEIFRPRVVLLNTLGDRDLFEDDYAPLNVYNDGFTTWLPGSIFPASCKLDLTKYPFDKQECRIKMVVMSYDDTELQFVPNEDYVRLSFFTENGEWDIVNSSITTPSLLVENDSVPSIQITFILRRKPVFMIISIILPIVFLSLLNLMVFVIPVESGEKISYGITVLLALTVFMSIMSAMLPRASESMPLMISYIFSLLTLSVLTVVVSIIIVKLHHMEEKEERSQKAQQNFRLALPRIKNLQRAVAPMEKSLRTVRNAKEVNRCGSHPELSSSRTNLRPVDGDDVEYVPRSNGSIAASVWSGDEVKTNRYKEIGKHIDLVSLVVFAVLWVGITLGFFIAIAA